jgi:RNA recognition motif-containing protein
MLGVRLIVRDFPYGTTVDQLRQLFEPHAEVMNIEMPVHATGEPKDFALVDVADEAQANDAARHLHGHVFEGRRLRVKIAVPHKIGEGGVLAPEQARAQPEVAPPTVIERPERHFLRTTRTQRRV